MDSHLTDNQPRYSLRQLLAWMTALAVYFAGLGWALRNAHDGRAASILQLAPIFLIFGACTCLYHWRRRSILLQAAGRRHATLRPASALREFPWSLLPLIAAMGLLLCFLFDNRTSFANFLLPMLVALPLVWFTNRIVTGAATVTDGGLVALARLTPWSEVHWALGDDGSANVVRVPIKGRRKLSPGFLVPENVRPTVDQLIIEAHGASR